MNKPIMITAAFCLLYSFVNAKNLAADTIKVTAAENSAIEKFNKGIGRQSGLYNGPEYTPYQPYIKNSPYFNDSKDLLLATVAFNGYTYNNVPVKYDLVKDLLVASYPNSGALYVLAPERLTYFTLMGHDFKYISADTVRKGPGFGFYEQLYAGKTSALIKYSKKMQSSVADNMVDAHFTDVEKEYFIQKGVDILSFSNQGSLLSILKDHKKQLQQYIKANNIDYKNQRELAVKMIVSYYEHLNN